MPQLPSRTRRAAAPADIGTAHRRYVLPGPAFAVAARMTKDVATCDEGTTIEEIMETMTRCRFRHMPVVENGRVTGIVSIGDVVKTRIAETIREAQALKEYIAAG